MFYERDGTGWNAGPPISNDKLTRTSEAQNLIRCASTTERRFAETLPAVTERTTTAKPKCSELRYRVFLSVSTIFNSLFKINAFLWPRTRKFAAAWEKEAQELARDISLGPLQLSFIIGFLLGGHLLFIKKLYIRVRVKKSMSRDR